MEGGGNPVPPLEWGNLNESDGGSLAFGMKVYSSSDPLSARSLGDAGSGGSERNSLTRVDDDQIGRMVLEVAPGVLGGTGGATVTSGPLEAMQDTPVPMSATQQRLENKSYPSRSRTASEASSERRGSGAVRQKKEKNRKSRQEKEEEFTALIPRSILDEYPTKSLQRCFSKLDKDTIKAMSEAQIRAAYKSWRATEAQQRKELRAHKRSHSSAAHGFGRTRGFSPDDSVPYGQDAYERLDGVSNGDKPQVGTYGVVDVAVAASRPLTKRQRALFVSRGLGLDGTGVSMPASASTVEYAHMSSDIVVDPFIQASFDESSSEYFSNTESEKEGPSVQDRRSSSDTITSTGVAGTTTEVPPMKKLRTDKETKYGESAKQPPLGPPDGSSVDESRYAGFPLLHSDSTISLANAAATAAELMSTSRSRTNSREASSPRQFLSKKHSDSNTSLASMDTVSAVEGAASALEHYEAALTETDDGSLGISVPRRRFSGEHSGASPDTKNRISYGNKNDRESASSINDNNRLATDIYPSLASLALAGEHSGEGSTEEVDLSITFPSKGSLQTRQNRDRAGSDAAEVLANVQAIMMSPARNPTVEMKKKGITASSSKAVLFDDKS